MENKQVFESQPLSTLTLKEVIELNNSIQAKKEDPQSIQNSFEKLGIQEWEEVEITSEELLNLQYFVEHSGAVPSAYYLWKFFGKNVKVKDLIQECKNRANEIPKQAQPFVNNILEQKDIDATLEENIKNGKIDPPLLLALPIDLPFIGRVNAGTLNNGNILDGNHRIFEIAKWLTTQPQEVLESFKLKVILGRPTLHQYIIFNTYYLNESWLKPLVIDPIKKMKGEEMEQIDPEHVMGFFDKYYLLLQRLGITK